MGRRNIYTIEAPLASALVSGNTVSSTVNLKGWDGLAIVARYTASAPSADVLASAAYGPTANVVTSAAHGFKTGLLGAFTTSGGDQPAGLTETDYFIITINAAAYQYAPNAIAAESGTFMPFSDAGTGNHTFTPDAANVSIQYQGSLDNSTYVAISTVNVTTDSCNTLWNVDKPHYLYGRVQYIVNAGQGTFQVDTSKETD